MSQCVPSWDLDDHSRFNFLHVPSLELDHYEVEDLTWKNGQVAMNGKNYAWDKPRAGTLECIVNQATDGAPWFDHERNMVHPGGMAMDALVPCGLEPSGTCSTRVGSCSGRRGSDNTTEWERELSGAVFTSSPENTSSDNTTSAEADYEDDDLGKKKGSGKSITSSKRDRASAFHTLSERKRRDKINERMRTLQKLVPNSTKTDKASILDEVIEYVKQLQAQVQMMNMAFLSPMLLQQAWNQYLHYMFMMRMGINAMDLNRPTIAPLPVPMPMPMTLPTSWDVQSIANATFATPPAGSPDLLSALLATQGANLYQQPSSYSSKNPLQERKVDNVNYM